MSMTTGLPNESARSWIVSRDVVRQRLEGKRVAIVGSGPGCLENEPGFVDSHDVVVRVNNYRLRGGTGLRTDVFYSFFGLSIKKSADDLKRDGVNLCICKCPDAKFIESSWHKRKNKMRGVDFRMIYQERAEWWFCDTYIPTVDEFLAHFHMLGGHVPTTGFAAILDVLSYKPSSVYLTGFDFFASGIHNVDEPWRRMNPSDPIGHTPDAERRWLRQHARELPITADQRLSKMLRLEVKG